MGKIGGDKCLRAYGQPGLKKKAQVRSLRAAHSLALLKGHHKIRQ